MQLDIKKKKPTRIVGDKVTARPSSDIKESCCVSKAELSSDEDAAEEIADEVTVDASKIADLPVEAVNSSSNTAEEEGNGNDVDQVNDMQEKGFRAWLSRTFRRQQNNRNHHPTTKVKEDDQD